MLKLGTVVKPYGRVCAVALIEGERYYFLLSRGSVAMMPAAVVELMAAPANQPRGGRVRSR